MKHRLLSVILLLTLLVSSVFCCVKDSSLKIKAENTYEKVSDSYTEYNAYLTSVHNITNAKENINFDCVDATISDDALLNTDGVELLNPDSYVLWTFDVHSTGIYTPVIEYTAITHNDNPIEMALQLDGKIPFSNFGSFKLNRLWKDASDTSFDEDGNEFAPEQIECLEIQKSGIYDTNGFITEAMGLVLEKGTHTIKLLLTDGKIKMHSFSLSIPDETPEYADVLKEYQQKSYKKYTGDEIVLEGEDAITKSSKFLIAQSCRSDVAVMPSDPYVERINYIGGSNWKSVGDTISWEVDIKQEGLYKLGFHFHQTYLQEGVSYRKLTVDGKAPFEEASCIPFEYSKWKFKEFADDNQIPYEFYLSKGKHTISLSVTLGNLSDFSLELQRMVDEIGKIYRSIVMITGETPDSNRDYNLFESIPNLEKDLKRIKSKLEELAGKSEELIGSEGGSSAQILRKAAFTIKQMLKKKYEAQKKLSSYYDNYAALSSWLYEMQNMALDIDAIVLAAPQKNFVRSDSGFFEGLIYSAQRILASFANDYASTKQRNDKQITLWSNWGRDQLRVLSSLITNDFTPETGIKVDLRITNASIVQANLSGNCPDVEIMLGRTDPVNYAMRGTLYDLSKFDDYDEVITRFGNTAMTPYQYQGGVYGLPDTQTFSVMFVRTDIFEELSLNVPKTWDEFILVSKVLALNNMESAVGEGATLFLTQKNVELYSKDRLSTNLNNAAALEALSFWTDLYTKYNLPVTYDFFNRFRTGLIPMGIQPYTMYAVLKAAAPEINGRWAVYELPGFVDENGNINNSAVGAGTAAVILNASDNKDESWEFLKWWTSEDIQYRFCNGVESVLGVTGRAPTSNINALYRLGWDTNTLYTLKKQVGNLKEIPEIPGSYYVARSIQQIYWNVVNNGQNLNEMTDKWATEADDEIRRKTAEYTKNNITTR